jgi:hypothetical protein
VVSTKPAIACAVLVVATPAVRAAGQPRPAVLHGGTTLVQIDAIVTDDVYQAANRANVAFNPIDPRGGCAIARDHAAANHEHGPRPNRATLSRLEFIEPIQCSSALPSRRTRWYRDGCSTTSASRPPIWLTHTTAAVEVRLALGGLAAADYVIEINANFHGESAQQFVAFRLAAR